MSRRKTTLSPNNNDWLVYNASEYTVNGKTYRNLEAEVLYNHNLSEQNAEDIDALEGRMQTAENEIIELEKKITWVTYDTTPFSDIYSGWSDNNLILMYRSGMLYTLVVCSNTTALFVHSRMTTAGQVIIRGIEVENTNDWTDLGQLYSSTSLTSTSDNQVPTSKAVADYLAAAIAANGGLFWCTHGTTTEAEIAQALTDGKLPVLLYNNNLYVYCWETAGYRYFQTSVNNSISRIQMLQSSSSWGSVTNLQLQNMANKVTSIDANVTDAQYPSAKAVYDYVTANGKGIYWCTYGTTTVAQVAEAITAGLLPIVIKSDENTHLPFVNDDGTYYRFTGVNRNSLKAYYLNKSTGAWTVGYNQAAVISTQIQTSISSSSTDTQIPSAKLLYDQLLLKQPNLFYECTYGSTTYAAITTAVNSGLIPYVKYSGVVYFYSYSAASSNVNYHYFAGSYYTSLRRTYVREDTNAWANSSGTAQTTTNKKSVPQTSSLTTYYPDFSYINNYEHQLKVTFTHGSGGSGTADKTYTDINTAYSRGRQVILVDNLGNVYQLSRFHTNAVLFTCCYMANDQSDIACLNVQIAIDGTITTWDNLGG